jgi:antitoxin component YwqK of YwqJK toxin-antitoxin module
VRSETHYTDDLPAPPPSRSAAAGPAEAAPAQPESAVTVKSVSLARGERFSFQLNGKYIGKLHLDKNYNLISRGGKIPDGAVKAYTDDGRLEKEFIFEDKALKALRVYEPGGPLKAEYTYEKDKAIKK